MQLETDRERGGIIIKIKIKFEKKNQFQNNWLENVNFLALQQKRWAEVNKTLHNSSKEQGSISPTRSIIIRSLLPKKQKAFAKS